MYFSYIFCVFDHFFVADVQKWRYFDFQSEIWHYHLSQRHWFHVKKLKFWQSGDILHNFWLYFQCACTEMTTCELPLKIMTPIFNSTTPISYRLWYIFCVFDHFFIAHAHKWCYFYFQSKIWHHHSQRCQFHIQELNVGNFGTFCAIFGCIFPCTCTETAI